MQITSADGCAMSEGPNDLRTILSITALFSIVGVVGRLLLRWPEGSVVHGAGIVIGALFAGMLTGLLAWPTLFVPYQARGEIPVYWMASVGGAAWIGHQVAYQLAKRLIGSIDNQEKLHE